MPSDGKHFIEDNTCRWCLRALGLPWQITTTWWLKAAEMYSPAVYKARVQKWRCLRVADSLGEALRSQSMRILCRLVSPPLVVAHYPCIPWNVAAPLCLQAPSSLPLCLSCPSWSLMRLRLDSRSILTLHGLTSILTLNTSAKPLFPNKLTFWDSRWMSVGDSGGGGHGSGRVGTKQALSLAASPLNVACPEKGRVPLSGNA